MPEAQSSSFQTSKALFIAGGLCSLVGLFMYGQRTGLAGFFFGAQFLFGLPLTNLDAFKVSAMAASSLITILMGIVIMGAGVALLLKPSNPDSGASQENS